MIHKSHTRKDIVELIETFEFPIEDYQDLTKNYLFKLFWEYVVTLETFQGNEEFPNLDHLKDYLQKPNQNRLKINEREKYISIAKQIIFYVNNGCILSYTNYLSEDELCKDVKKICNYCNLPTCLRAVTLLNKSRKFDTQFEPILTGKVKVLLRKKEEERLMKINNFKWRDKDQNGGRPFLVIFD